jgi:hypothetical protein
MEELQTTEILDREILEDARKKACRILKTADDAVKTRAGEWEQKNAAAIAELKEKYAARRARAVGEIMARLPMEKRRAKAEKIESLLRQAVETWYAGLERGQVLSILKTELARRITECDALTMDARQKKAEANPSYRSVDPEMKAVICKLERNEAESILQTVLPGSTCAIVEMPSAALYPEIILENNAVRIIASIYKTADFFLHEKRAELAEALLGNAALLQEDALC